MTQEVTERVNKLGGADRQPSLLTLYDCHCNPVGDTKNPNADLTDAPEDDTEEDNPVPEITGVDQDYPDEHQDQEPPDELQNEQDINYRTEEVGDPIEDAFQSNDDPQPQDKEPVQLLDTEVPSPTWRSTHFKKSVSHIVLSFFGKKYDTAATLIK